MKLSLVNIGIFKEKNLVVPDRHVVLILEPSASGKTTIARVLDSFLTGKVDAALLKSGAKEGTAILELDNKRYRLYISKEVHHVDRVLNAEYSEYLVLTEHTPLHSIYVSPEHMDVEDLAKKLVPEPPELRKLESQILRAQPKYTDISKTIDELRENIAHYQTQLEEIERKLKEIDEKIKEQIPIEKANIVLKKRQIESRIEDLEKRIKEFREEHSHLLAELNSVEYEEMKKEKEKLRNEIMMLHNRKLMLERAKKGYELIKQGLDNLDQVMDVLYEINAPLFGQIVDAETIRSFKDECDAAITTIVSVYSDIQAKLHELEARLDEIEAELTKYIRKYDRMASIESEISRMENELRQLRYELTSVQRKASEILRELNISEEELLEKLMKQEDISRLVQERRDLERKRDNIISLIESVKRTIERLEKEKEEAEKQEKEYQELQKKYNTLKNEWIKKRKMFKEAFKAAFRDAFRNTSIPDFDPVNMKIYRPPHTYSQSERLFITVAYQYALVKALAAIGEKVPLVVIDLIVPIDSHYENEIKRLALDLPTRVLILKTSDKPSIISIA